MSKKQPLKKGYKKKVATEEVVATALLYFYEPDADDIIKLNGPMVFSPYFEKDNIVEIFKIVAKTPILYILRFDFHNSIKPHVKTAIYQLKKSVYFEFNVKFKIHYQLMTEVINDDYKQFLTSHIEHTDRINIMYLCIRWLN